MVIQPCVCIAASHVGLAGLPVLAVYSSATFCISATLFCFSFTDILSKISFFNFCGAKVQLFFDIRKHLEKKSSDFSSFNGKSTMSKINYPKF